MMPQEHRAAAAERHEAERVLEAQGWTVISVPKNFIVHANIPPLTQMMKWCEDTLGTGRIEPGANWLDEHDVWYSFSWYGYWTFHFKHEKDAMAFTLRWI